MDNPAKDWREEFDEKYNQLTLWNGLGYGNVHTEIKTLIEREKTKSWNEGFETGRTKDWREEFGEKFVTTWGVIKKMEMKVGDMVLTGKNATTHDIKDFIQNILDAHTAHLVERIENMAIVDDYGEERKIGFQIAKDQAIDIVKDKPPTV